MTLSPELQQFVDQKALSGPFSSAEDVVAKAVELLKSDDEVAKLNPEQLRAEIEVGMEQSRRGESTPLNMQDIKQKVRERLASLRS